jgi:hypothetical protein
VNGKVLIENIVSKIPLQSAVAWEVETKKSAGEYGRWYFARHILIVSLGNDGIFIKDVVY